MPAFFAQWAPILCEAAGVRPGQRVLDVACGTGIVARTAADLVAPEGKVVGLDLNEAMLAVARRIRPDIEYHQGDAAALPFPDGSFDIALCQMALMFFPDRTLSALSPPNSTAALFGRPSTALLLSSGTVGLSRRTLVERPRGSSTRIAFERRRYGSHTAAG